jgi:integrase
MPLSDMQCKNAKPNAKRYKLADFEGLYLEVMPSGTKTWRIKYRFHGKENSISIGTYPHLSLAGAREQKVTIKGQLLKGINPLLARREKEQTDLIAANTRFEDVAREWHEKQAVKWSPRHAQTILHRLEKYVFPFLGDFPVKTIKPLMVLDVLQRIERTAPEMTRRVKQYISQVFLYAIITSRCEVNPANGLEQALRKYQKSHFASISVDELPKFLRDLKAYQPRLSRQTYLAIWLMLLTFVRTSELIKAKWSEIDWENKLWSIPAERMKMKRPHLVPLSTQAISMLAELKEMNGHWEHIFPSIPRPRKHMSNGTVLVALKRMEYNGKMTGHGFRALAMGVLKEKLGYSHELVDRQLAHVQKNGNDRAYDRGLFLSQRAEMMQKFADYIQYLPSGDLSSKALPS